MIKFVLDNSVAMRWLLTTQKKADQSYANEVLQGMVDGEALAPHLWHLEATNVLYNRAVLDNANQMLSWNI